MNQSERKIFLIKEMLHEQHQYSGIKIPANEQEQRNRISMGGIHFPNDKAAEIAAKTVKGYRQQTNSKMEVIFNVFKDAGYKIYRNLFGTD